VPAETTLEFTYPDASSAQIVAESIAREVGDIDDERSSTTLSYASGDRQLIVRIIAHDLIALRAAINTWFSLVTVAERTVEVGRRRTALS